MTRACILVNNIADGDGKEFILFVKRNHVVAPPLDGRSAKRMFTAKTPEEAFVRHTKPSSHKLPRRACSAVTDIATKLLVYLKS